MDLASLGESLGTGLGVGLGAIVGAGDDDSWYVGNAESSAPIGTSNGISHQGVLL